MKSSALWVIAPCSLVEVERRFKGVYCLHCQDDDEGSVKRRRASTTLDDAVSQKAVSLVEFSEVSEVRTASIIRVMLEAVRVSETSVCFNETALCNISESCNLHTFPFLPVQCISETSQLSSYNSCFVSGMFRVRISS
jgi:hypothetical protein